MDWKDHPHLFANGKFYISRSGQKEQVIGITNCGNRLLTPTVSVGPANCTLIARRIESMPDEELREILQMDGFEDEDLGRAIEDGRADLVLEFLKSSRDGFLELLSRGYYPFEWPDDKSVIDIKTLDQ